MKLFRFEKSNNYKKITILGIKITFKKKFVMPKQLIDNQKFYKTPVRKNSVLIVEPNPYHAEILPGFVKYFQDLNYNVDIILRHENFYDSSFVDYKDINVFNTDTKNIKKYLHSSKIKDYKIVFVSSYDFGEAKKHQYSFLKYIKSIPYLKNKLFIAAHDLKNYFNQNTTDPIPVELFSLSGFQNTKMLNPHYFGEIQITPKSKDKTRFIVVGGINKNNKNYDLLLQCTKELLEYNTNFEITIIGLSGKIDIPDELANYIKFKGKLPFAEMYKEMEKADFFLPLLDPSNEWHRRYLNETTTGSRQLILGFLKPCLINEEFANAYDFNQNNSIIYQQNNLLNAMKAAININSEEYEKLQKNLNLLAQNIYKESLQNLKDSIEKNF